MSDDSDSDSVFSERTLRTVEKMEGAAGFGIRMLLWWLPKPGCPRSRLLQSVGWTAERARDGSDDGQR